jgi:hypothetical protein
MNDIMDKNWRELSQQVADLQVKAFLSVICQIGEVLDKQVGRRPDNLPNNLPTPARRTIAGGKSTGIVENIVTSVTDRGRTPQISSGEPK